MHRRRSLSRRTSPERENENPPQSRASRISGHDFDSTARHDDSRGSCREKRLGEPFRQFRPAVYRPNVVAARRDPGAAGRPPAEAPLPSQCLNSSREFARPATCACTERARMRNAKRSLNIVMLLHMTRGSVAYAND